MPVSVTAVRATAEQNLVKPLVQIVKGDRFKQNVLLGQDGRESPSKPAGSSDVHALPKPPREIQDP